MKESQPVHPKGDQPWVFIGGTDVEAETPIVWPELGQKNEKSPLALHSAGKRPSWGWVERRGR